ncbi:MAG TPA: hypothetical protein VF210_21720 [Pseudomonadales bacterium]
MKRSLLTTLMVIGVGVPTALWANPTNTAGAAGSQTATASSAADNGGASANEASQALAINNSGNMNDLSDNSNNAVTDSFNTDASINDSGNLGVDLQNIGNTDASINDSGNLDLTASNVGNDRLTVTGSGNTTTTDSGNFSLTLDAAVNTADLDGTVSGNALTIGHAATYTSTNRIADGALTDVSGITLVGQNGGANSLIQQNVSVQSSLTLQ